LDDGIGDTTGAGREVVTYVAPAVGFGCPGHAELVVFLSGAEAWYLRPFVAEDIQVLSLGQLGTHRTPVSLTT
jgi:hypothetical protein